MDYWSCVYKELSCYSNQYPHDLFPGFKFSFIMTTLSSRECCWKIIFVYWQSIGRLCVLKGCTVGCVMTRSSEASYGIQPELQWLVEYEWRFKLCDLYIGYWQAVQMLNANGNCPRLFYQIFIEGGMLLGSLILACDSIYTDWDVLTSDLVQYRTRSILIYIIDRSDI